MTDSRLMIEATTPAEGLSDEEAAARLKRDGPNRITRNKPRSVAAAAIGVMTQPMFMLLLATATVYALLGSLDDALVLLVSVVVVAAISLAQEVRTERVLASLKELSSPRSRVVRGGRVQRIASQELVVGDRLLVGEGDRLACDAVLEQANGLFVDESMLTGESAPVLKSAASSTQTADPETAGPALEETGPPAAAPVEQQAPHAPQNCVLAGTLVVQGDGVGTVYATGERTVLGGIGGTLARIEPRTSRVHQAHGRPGGGVRGDRLPGGRRALRPAPGILDFRSACRPDAGNGTHSGGVRGRLDGHARTRRMAPRAAPRAHPADPGDRGPGHHDRAGGRQDRHADPQPHGSARPRHAP